MACPCTPIIKRDGQLINATTKRRYALPGQQIHLQITGCTGIQESSVQWTIPGTIFADWVISEESATVVPASPNGHSDITFYWASAPGTITISVSFLVSGQQCSAQAEMEIIAPTVTLLELGSGQVQCFWHGTRRRVGLATYGSLHAGVYIRYKVDVPLNPAYGFSAGKTTFCQVLESAKERWRNFADKCFHASDENCTCLDAIGPEFNTNSDISIFDDSWPSSPLDDALKEVYGTRPARNVLMFLPAGTTSEWVPLKLVTWNATWCSKNCDIAGWKLLSKSKSLVGPSSITQHPVWSCYYHAGQAVEGPPCPSCGSCGPGSFGCFQNATHL
jgi:hypothetical protein